jgi:nucleolar protein 14
LQYETYSQRVVPEAINFLATAILALAPPSFNLDPIPGTFPLRKDARELGVYLKPKLASKLQVRTADLPSLMDCDRFGKEYEQDKVDILGLALRLLGRYAEMHKDLVGFIEVFEPFYEIIYTLSNTNVPASIKVRAHGGCLTAMTEQELISLVVLARPSVRKNLKS